jgi:hypothetical protein
LVLDSLNPLACEYEKLRFRKPRNALSAIRGGR